MAILIKRVYEAGGREDGFRILVDRLWPRGISKERAKLDLWMKEVAPSDALRKWFSHKPERWAGFVKRYRAELREKKALLSRIRELEREKGTITLVFGARDVLLNNAAALKKVL
jgi:uncharacterized protein YeaO (DUF488 family)